MLAAFYLPDRDRLKFLAPLCPLFRTHGAILVCCKVSGCKFMRDTQRGAFPLAGDANSHSLIDCIGKGFGFHRAASAAPTLLAA